MPRWIQAMSATGPSFVVPGPHPASSAPESELAALDSVYCPRICKRNLFDIPEKLFLSG